MGRKGECKYKSYAELAAAFKSGELDMDRYYLMLDKGAQENVLCRKFDESLSEEENERLDEECGKLFDGDREIDELFEVAGIPAEWC